MSRSHRGRKQQQQWQQPHNKTDGKKAFLRKLECGKVFACPERDFKKILFMHEQSHLSACLSVRSSCAENIHLSPLLTRYSWLV